MSRPVYLITGGTGFLGSHLVEQLLALGCRPRLLVRSDPGQSRIPGVEYVISSLDDQKTVRKAAEDCQGLFHLAGLVAHTRQPEEVRALQATNVDATMAILLAIAPLKIRVVFASTSGVVACQEEDGGLLTDDSPYSLKALSWPYYRSKIEAELKAKQFALNHGIPLVCMRPAVMLGPGDTRFRSTHFIASFLQRKIPVVPTGGYAFLDVRDAAAAFIAAMRITNPSPTYLLCASAPKTSVFLKELENLSGVKAPSLMPPASVTLQVAKTLDLINRKVRGKWDPGVDPVRAEMGACFWGASSKLAEKELGFKPRPPIQTLNETINYILENHPAFINGEREGERPRAKL